MDVTVTAGKLVTASHSDEKANDIIVRPIGNYTHHNQDHQISTSSKIIVEKQGEPSLSMFKEFVQRLANDDELREEMTASSVYFCALNALIICNLKPVQFVHYSFSLTPALVNLNEYLNMCKVTKYLHKFIDGMSRDLPFLIQTFGDTLETDFYLGRYLDICKKKLKLKEFNQDIHLGLYRNDFMQSAVDNHWIQIELNVAGVGCFMTAQNVHKMRQWMLKRYGNIDIPIFDFNENENNGNYDESKEQPLQQNIYLSNGNSFECIVRTLAIAAKLVHKQNPIVLVIPTILSATQIVEQKGTEFELLSRYNVICIRRSLLDLCKSPNTVRMDAETKELIVDGYRISCVYQYQSQTAYTIKQLNMCGFERAMKVLEIIEFSTAIKENMAYVLLGTKIMQSFYSGSEQRKKALLEKYLTVGESELVQKYCLNVHCLDPKQNEDACAIIDDALLHSDKYVLKINRDAGGNVFFDQDLELEIERIKNEFQSQCQQQQSSSFNGYILMDRIYARTLKSWFVVNRKCSKLLECNTEVGIYSCFLGGKNGRIYVDEICGNFCKTKMCNVNAASINHRKAVLDNCLLFE